MAAGGVQENVGVELGVTVAVGVGIGVLVAVTVGGTVPIIVGVGVGIEQWEAKPSSPKRGSSATHSQHWVKETGGNLQPTDDPDLSARDDSSPPSPFCSVP